METLLQVVFGNFAFTLNIYLPGGKPSNETKSLTDGILQEFLNPSSWYVYLIPCVPEDGYPL